MIVPGEVEQPDEVGTEAHESSRPPTRSQSSGSVGSPSKSSSRQSSITQSWNLTMSSVSEAVGKLGGNFARQATLDEDLGSNYSGKSLLHQKLVEKNLSLKKNIDQYMAESIGRVPKDLEAILSQYGKTQVYFQETVIAMQQANHYTAEVLESMDDFVEISNSIRFPD